MICAICNGICEIVCAQNTRTRCAKPLSLGIADNLLIVIEMNRYRALAVPAYIVGLSVFAVPLIDAAAQLWPFGLGSATWRFGAIGLLSNAFIIPVIGLLILLATAVVLEHKRVLSAIGWASAISAVIIPPLIVLFALDAVQTRVDVRPEIKLSFAVASFTAVGKLLLAMVTLFAFAVTVRKTLRPSPLGQGVGRAPTVIRTPVKKASAG